MGGSATAVVVEFPLRGEWVAVRTPAHKVPSHGTELLGQRYAFDLVRPDQRRGLHLQPAGAVRSFLLGGRMRDYYGWGGPSMPPSTAGSWRPWTGWLSGRGSRWCARSRWR